MSMSQLQSNQTSFHHTTLSHILKWVQFHWSEYFKFHENDICIKCKGSNALVKGVWKPMGKFLNLHKWKDVKSVRFEFLGLPNLQGENLEFYARNAGEYFKELERIEFAFSGCKNIAIKEFKFFAVDGFKRLETLNIIHLHLDFYGCRSIDEKKLKLLAYGITHFLNKLQKLELLFDYCNKITDDSLKRFSLSLFKNLTYLQHLFLSLEGWNQMTDKGFKALISHLDTYLSRLKYLKLTCGACQEVANESLKYFGSSETSNLQSIQHLSLTFTWNQKIQDEGLQSLFENLANFVQLKKLELIFYGCGEITNESLTKIPVPLAQLHKHLDTVILDFTSCVKISQKARDDLAQNLNFIPNLTIK